MQAIDQLEDQIRGVLRMRREPELFFTDVLGVPKEYIWDKMLEVMHSVRDNEKTAVKAGHSVSKSFTASRLALWFLYCFGPKCTVITTAPTEKHVKDVLWREIRDAKGSAIAELEGKITTKQLDLGEKWFATGFATKPDTVTEQATAFQGYHNEFVLVIFDEAAGILPQIWEAAESLITDEDSNCKWLAIGNPTSSFGNFPDCFKDDSGWNQVTISVKDTPNYKQGKKVVPGLAGRKYEKQMNKKYGNKSNIYLSRVLGEIPEFTEGAIWGKEIRQAKQSGRVLDNIPHETSCLVHTAWDLGIDDAMAIWFFQIVGQEVHVIDYYEYWGEGLVHYIDLLHEKRKENGWIYGTHLAPHDIKVRQLTDGATRLETAKKLGVDFTVVGKPGDDGPVNLSLKDGIEAARQELNRCWFDKTRCKQGLKNLSEYHWKKLQTVSTDDRPVYSGTPEHDHSSNGADAFRYMCIGLKYNISSYDNQSSNTYSDWSSYYGKAV